MRPVTHPDLHDAPQQLDQPVPIAAAEPDDVIVVTEHTVSQPVVAHELPNVLHHIQLRAFGWQW